MNNKKIILTAITAITFAAITIVTTLEKDSNVSLLLQNVEALATGNESGGILCNQKPEKEGLCWVSANGGDCCMHSGFQADSCTGTKCPS